MAKKHSAFLILLLSFLNLTTFSQENGRATGRILDKETGAPITDVNVFIVNTTLGAATAANGRYEIDNVPPGKYVLVASVVGYERKRLVLEIQNNKSTQVDFELKKEPVQLSDVTVKAQDLDEWEEYYEIFKKELLGEFEFADSCTILNPSVIFFSLGDDDILRASSDEFISLENKGLGYKIELLLNKFSWDMNSDIGSYSVYPFFQEIEGKNDAQLTAWKENRKRAYLGSFRHFLQCVVNKTLLSTKFALYSGSVGGFQFKQKEPVLLENLDIKFGEDFVTFCLKDPYLIQNGYLNHFTGLKLKMNQNCIIIPHECLQINYNGILLNPDKVQLSGYWANQRIADALPYDYKPD